MGFLGRLFGKNTEDNDIHEATKKDLAQMRKAGSTPEPTKQAVKKKPIDASEEKELRRALENARNAVSKHYALIALSEFCYKYRDVRPDYLQECIDLCNEDIALLPEIQRVYVAEEIQRSENLRGIHSGKEIDARNKEIAERGLYAGSP